MIDSSHSAHSPRLLNILGILTVFGVFAVNAMGFVDHDTHSGQGCSTQWPLCQGVRCENLVARISLTAMLCWWDEVPRHPS